MTDHPRYAIYYAPAADAPLARFGASVLGYDAFTGTDTVVPPALAAQADWPALTGDPRKYGFHATLKAPFHLAADSSEAGLIAAFEAFAATSRGIPVIAPVVRTISGFTAIVPAHPAPALGVLAQTCVTAFEPFRAPMTARERARRKPETLTARQVAQLDRYGYPYVGDDFRFHMTLTGRLPAARGAEVLALLQTQFAGLRLGTLAIDRIALFRQDAATARFRVLRHTALTP